MADFPDWSRPNTFQQDLIANDFAALAGHTYDVSLYASVIIEIGVLDGASPMAVLYEFVSASGFVLDKGLLSANVSTTGATWWLPVVGPNLKIFKLIGGTQITLILGSNSVAPGKRMLSDYLLPRGLTANVPNGTATLTRTQLTTPAPDGSALYNDLTGFNGECVLVATVFSMSGATEWDFQLEALDYDGTKTVLNVIKMTSATTVQLNFPHPRAYVTWFVRNIGALTSAANLELDVHPNALA